MSLSFTKEIPGEGGGSPPSNKSARRRRQITFRSFLEAIAVALLIALVLRVWVVSGYSISSGSMKDTILVGDFIVVDKLVYRFWEPERGDVVLFKYPHQDNRMNPLKWLAELARKMVGKQVPIRRDMVKRIIGLPGEEVLIEDGVVYIDQKPLDEPYLKNPPDYNWGPKRVPAGSYFVLGDNRSESDDSHRWGFVPGELIVGRIELIFWSWLPGRCNEQVLRLKSGASEKLLLLPCGGEFSVVDEEIGRTQLSDAELESAKNLYICDRCGRIYRQWWDGSNAPSWQFWERIRFSRIGMVVE